MSTTETVPAAPSPRLNLIFHGLMAFWDAGDHYEVLIPKPGTGNCHEALYGNPLDCGPFYCLQDLEHGAKCRVDGITAPNKPTKPARVNGIVLNQSYLEPPIPGHVRATITIPKPDLIRHYRGEEAGTHNFTGKDNDTGNLFKVLPKVVHEVIVFSYFTFNKPQFWDGKTPHDIKARAYKGMGPFYNLGIYCQPVLEDCAADDSALFNNMFHFKSNGKNPKVDVYMTGADTDNDGPVSTGANVGIDWWELLSLSELDRYPAHFSVSDAVAPTSVSRPRPLASIGGCVSAVVCKDADAD